MKSLNAIPPFIQEVLSKSHGRGVRSELSQIKRRAIKEDIKNLFGNFKSRQLNRFKSIRDSAKGFKDRLYGRLQNAVQGSNSRAAKSQAEVFALEMYLNKVQSLINENKENKQGRELLKYDKTINEMEMNAYKDFKKTITADLDKEVTEDKEEMEDVEAILQRIWKISMFSINRTPDIKDYEGHAANRMARAVQTAKLYFDKREDVGNDHQDEYDHPGKISDSDKAEITKELDKVMADWNEKNKEATEDQKKAQEEKEKNNRS